LSTFYSVENYGEDILKITELKTPQNKVILKTTSPSWSESAK